MKKFSANGKGTGKLGGSVYLINHGMQIEREYNQKVNNPNTILQVGQRSKFKLASQVSAALGLVIAFPRKGILSPRNLFVKRNFNFFYTDEEGAYVTYENLQLAPGTLGLPAVRINRTETAIEVELNEDAGGGLNRVVYNVFKKSTEGLLLYITSAIVPFSFSPSQKFPANLPLIEGEVIVYAYGIRDNSTKATTNFENYNVTTGVDVAKLFVSRRLSLTDYTFSQTRANTVFTDDDASTDAPEGSSVVYLTTEPGGTVAATGVTFRDGRGVVANGTSITLTANATSGWYFRGWWLNGRQVPTNTANVYTAVVNGNIDLIARFANQGGLE